MFKRMIQLVIVLGVIGFVLGYWFDVPYLNRVKGLVGNVSEELPKGAESADNCYQCEQFCSDRYKACLQENKCDEFGDQAVFRTCSEKCTDRYRACYLGCTGKFDKTTCPQPSLSGIF